MCWLILLIKVTAILWVLVCYVKVCKYDLFCSIADVPVPALNENANETKDEPSMDELHAIIQELKLENEEKTTENEYLLEEMNNVDERLVVQTKEIENLQNTIAQLTVQIKENESSWKKVLYILIIHKMYLNYCILLET